MEEGGKMGSNFPTSDVSRCILNLKLDGNTIVHYNTGAMRKKLATLEEELRSAISSAENETAGPDDAPAILKYEDRPSEDMMMNDKYGSNPHDRLGSIMSVANDDRKGFGERNARSKR